MTVALCIACNRNRASWRGFCQLCKQRMGHTAVRAIERDARESGGAFKVRSKVVARLQMTLCSVKAVGGGPAVNRLVVTIGILAATIASGGGGGSWTSNANVCAIANAVSAPTARTSRWLNQLDVFVSVNATDDNLKAAAPTTRTVTATAISARSAVTHSVASRATTSDPQADIGAQYTAAYNKLLAQNPQDAANLLWYWRHSQASVASRLRSAPMAATAVYPTWDASPTLIVPPDLVAWRPRVGFTVRLTDQLKSDVGVANRWAVQANEKCACPNYGVGSASPTKIEGYDWLKGNGAAYRDWAEHSAGEDPTTYFCKVGYDSPLAHYTERFTFNRRADEIGLTVAIVEYNGHEYPATIRPADCLAGCAVDVEVACEAPRHPTIIRLRAADAVRAAKCIAVLTSGKGMEIPCH